MDLILKMLLNILMETIIISMVQAICRPAGSGSMERIITLMAQAICLPAGSGSMEAVIT